MKPTLLILAAGMGSRYGKLKQMDAFGPNGETIIEYSLYDAINAGFGKVVFVIREYFAEEFKAYFLPLLNGKIEMEFVYQEINNVPDGTSYNGERTKPWGTAHAVFVAKDVIKEPFGVINADDYYGVEAYKTLAEFLINQYNQNEIDYSVVGYHLKNTLSDHGTVNRGVCSVDANGHLTQVKECIKIKKDEDGIVRYTDENGIQTLSEDTLVSMNMWGFLPSYFTHCEKLFVEFLKNEGHLPTSEFFIPILIDHLISNKILNVKVLDTESDWFGVTYQEDKPFVMQKIKDLIDLGVYPTKLW